MGTFLWVRVAKDSVSDAIIGNPHGNSFNIVAIPSCNASLLLTVIIYIRSFTVIAVIRQVVMAVMACHSLGCSGVCLSHGSTF